jgi:hypothetical protein
MEQSLLCPPNSAPLGASPTPRPDLADIDLIFVQDLGLLPKRLVTSSRPAPAPTAPRKWLGSDFSHVIISQ